MIDRRVDTTAHPGPAPAGRSARVARVAHVVHVVLPGDVDDTAAPSGGNVYDRRVCGGLAATGWSVREVAVPGSWPHPDATARAELARSLGALPEGAVVLIDGIVACGVPEIVVPQARRLRLAVLVHLPLADETGLAPAVAADLDARERATLHAAHAVVATSPWAARRLIDHHGLAASEVHAVPPGTDPAPLAPGSLAAESHDGEPPTGGEPPTAGEAATGGEVPTDDGTATGSAATRGDDGRGEGALGLLCVAAVTPRKGQDLLVEALAEVSDLAWTCICVGSLRRDPEYVAGLRQAIERHDLGGRVRLVGPRTGERLAASYAAADLMVLASRAETYAMVVTEALARGIPVLATAVDAVPETLGHDPDGGVPGILVPPEDPPALAAALRRWLAEPDLRRRVKVSARRRRGSLDGWEATSRRMSSVLERLRGGPR